MTYTVDYFIEKFSRIPREKWCTRAYTKGDKHCAIGHCGIGKKLPKEALALGLIFRDTLVVTSINDGSPKYQHLGAHPRTRILNALKRVKKGLVVV